MVAGRHGRVGECRIPSGAQRLRQWRLTYPAFVDRRFDGDLEVGGKATACSRDPTKARARLGLGGVRVGEPRVGITRRVDVCVAHMVRPTGLVERAPTQLGPPLVGSPRAFAVDVSALAVPDGVDTLDRLSAGAMRAAQGLGPARTGGIPGTVVSTPHRVFGLGVPSAGVSGCWLFVRSCSRPRSSCIERPDMFTWYGRTRLPICVAVIDRPDWMR